jgi:hypothetical protein
MLDFEFGQRMLDGLWKSYFGPPQYMSGGILESKIG